MEFKSLREIESYLAKHNGPIQAEISQLTKANQESQELRSAKEAVERAADRVRHFGSMIQNNPNKAALLLLGANAETMNRVWQGSGKDVDSMYLQPLRQLEKAISNENKVRDELKLTKYHIDSRKEQISKLHDSLISLPKEARTKFIHAFEYGATVSQEKLDSLLVSGRG